MNGKFEVGRIAGVPFLIDPTFLILAVMWMLSYLNVGTSQALALGFVVVIGIGLSILLHELAHAFVGQYFGTRTAFVELNGFGGLCHYASALPANPWNRIAISLAGPAVNLALYFLFDFVSDNLGPGTNPLFARLIGTMEIANWWMFVFNLLPAFPLDGGQALRDLLGMVLSGLTATKIVAGLGLFVCVGVVMYALQHTQLFLGLIAFLLGMINYKAFQDATRPPWQRWQ